MITTNFTVTPHPYTPFFVLGYTLKHNYSDLVNEAGIETIGMAVDMVFPDLPPEAHATWVSSRLPVIVYHASQLTYLC